MGDEKLSGSGGEPAGSGVEVNVSEAEPVGDVGKVVGSGAELVGDGGKVVGSGAELVGSGAEGVGSGAEGIGSGAELVDGGGETVASPAIRMKSKQHFALLHLCKIIFNYFSKRRNLLLGIFRINSIMSHIKNVDAYSRLVGLCTGLAGKYNPGQQNLQLKAMRALLVKAQSSLQDVKQTKTDYSNATNAREIVFGEIRSRVTPIMKLLKSSGTTAQTLKDANQYARLIRGRLANSRPPIPSAESDEPQEMPEKSVNQRSGTQQSYVSIAGHFGWLIQLLRSQPVYQPNEPELQIDSLTTLHSDALVANDQVAKAYHAWAMARMARNKVLYTAKVAVHDNAQAAKDYVAAVFGTQSEEYKQMTRIRFTKHVN